MSSVPHGSESALGLIGVINGMWMSQVVCVAAELGIADLLTDGSKPIQELAQATDSHPPSLHRLMRALVVLGLCRELDDGAFALTSIGMSLRANAPDSLHAWALWSRRYIWPLWGKLLDTVRTGQNARKLVQGTEDFGHLESDTAAAEAFNLAMVALSRHVGKELARAYDFTEIRLIIDVGGGYGGLLATILAACPQARGAVYDLPHLMVGARMHLANANIATRCEFISGSFFETIPSGADAYILKNIIHDWDDERSAEILRNCRRVIGPDAKLLIVERIMPTRLESTESHRVLARADLAMLVGLHGRTDRTRDKTE